MSVRLVKPREKVSTDQKVSNTPGRVVTSDNSAETTSSACGATVLSMVLNGGCRPKSFLEVARQKVEQSMASDWDGLSKLLPDHVRKAVEKAGDTLINAGCSVVLKQCMMARVSEELLRKEKIIA